MKPPDLFGRDTEWADLTGLSTASTPRVRVGVIYGRRRLGKSYLLRRLAREHNGLYHMALEEEDTPALQRFADTLATARGLEPGDLRARDWADALRIALSGDQDLLIIDELPYLLAHPAGRVIPSAIQSLVDQGRDSAGPNKCVIICGSALAVMANLLSGSQALRGRAQLDLLLRPFDFRTMADFYQIEDSAIAFRMYAVFGGVPGYRDLLGNASPQTSADFEQLILATVGNPSHALFDEPAYLLREDPRVSDRALYFSIINAIAQGARTPSKVAAELHRDVRSLTYALDVLTTSGFVKKDDDVLLQRRPTLRVADPIVRFHDVVITPRRATFEERKAQSAWDGAQSSVRCQIYGPAFEELAREWTARHASEETLGGPIGEVGSTVVNDTTDKSQHEIDVIALAAGQRRQSPKPVIRAIGEAKDSDKPRTLSDLTRLERIKGLLLTKGAEAGSTKLILYGRSGFSPDLLEASEARPDLELIDLHRIRYGS